MKKNVSILLTVAIPTSVVVLTMLVAVPAMSSLDEADAAREIVGLADRIAAAARRYHADTGRYAREIAAESAEEGFAAGRFHELSTPQFHRGWRGPYVPHALTCADNPFARRVGLHDDLESPPACGFQIKDGDDGRGRGQYLCFEAVPLEVARAVDLQIDGPAGANWMETGRVEFDADGRLSIFLFR